YTYKMECSLFKAFNSEMHIPIIINANGKAAINIAISRASSPPDHNKTEAIAARIIPQTTFTFVVGFNFPPVDNIASTNVPESAEVIKKEEIKITAIPIITADIGEDSRKPNNATSSPSSS